MIHILPVKFIKIPIVKKYLADLICARAPAIPTNHWNATISAATDIRIESGVSIIYRNCLGKNLGAPQYVNLQ